MEDKKKILIVEDDKMISSMYRTKLEQAGYMVLEAEDGPMGFDLAVKEKPVIILLDVILPQLDGFSVLTELKTTDGTRNIPVVMLTNLGTTEDREKGEKLGAVDYLVKADLTPSQIIDTITKYIK